MLDINVKTIDGQNRSYSVPDNCSVKQFKEKIANSLNIPIDSQRLIFQGRELKDTSALNEFDVDGKTLHLVQRLPPSQTPNRPRANTEEPSSQSTTTTQPNAPNTPDVNQIIQQLIGGFGEFGQNATFNTTTNTDTNGMEVHIDLGNVSQIVTENEIRSRIRNIRRFLTMTDARLNRLREIQSGAPLDDTPNSTIIVGSIQTTTALTDGNNIIGFETNQQNIRGPIDPRLLSLAGLTGSDTGNNGSQRVINTSIPLSSLLSPNLAPASTTNNSNTQSNPQSVPSESAPTQEETASNHQTQNIGVEVLADVTQNVMDAYSRFLPYMQQYHEMLTNDINEPPESPNPSTSAQSAFSFRPESTNTPTANPNVIVLGGDNRRQRFCNNINDMMHLLGHLFHNLSDLHVNIRDRPPRQMHTMSSMSHASSTIIGAAVPVEATIQIPLQIPMSGNGLASATTPGQNPIFFRRRPRSTQSFTSSTTTTTTSTDSNPSSSTTTTTTSNQPQAQPTGASLNLGARTRLGSNNPLNYATNNSYDQYLPCNSVHFYNSYNPILQQQFQQSADSGPQGATNQRRRHPAGDQQQQATTGNAQQAQAPSNDITRLISNILSSTLRGAVNEASSTSSTSSTTGSTNGSSSNQHFRVNIGGMPGQISIATISTSSEATTPTTTQTPNTTPLINSPRSQAPIIPNLTSMLFGNNSANPNPLSQLFSSLTRGQQQPAPSNTTSSQPGSDRVAGAILREAIGLMDSNNQNDQRLNQPLREFMRVFGSDDLDEVLTNSQTGSASLINIFNVFFSSLTLGDMIDLARGQNRDRVFATTREPLRQYLRPLISANNELTQENMGNLIDKLYNDVFEDSNGLNIDFNQFELADPQIDFRKSFENLVKLHLKQMLDHLFDETFDQSTTQNQNQNSTWSSILFEKFRNSLDQVVNLCRVCIKNADTKLLQLVVEKLRTGLTSGSSSINFGALFGPFEIFIRNHVQEVLNSVATNRSLIESYILYKPKETPDQPTTSASTTQNQSLINTEDDNKSIDSNQYDSASSTLSGNSMDLDQHFSDARQKLESKSSSEIEASNVKEEKSTLSSVNGEFPAEWIPIIEHDMEVQKTYSSDQLNRNFSDAYSSGMPAKKRKILSSKKDLLTENLFRKVLSRTLETIQLKSNVSEEQLVEESLNQSELIESFDSEFDAAITERLRQDDDFATIINQQQSSLASLQTAEKDSDNSNFYNKDRFSHSRKRLK